jgi:hypothetical protein
MEHVLLRRAIAATSSEVRLRAQVYRAVSSLAQTKNVENLLQFRYPDCNRKHFPLRKANLKNKRNRIFNELTNVKKYCAA